MLRYVPRNSKVRTPAHAKQLGWHVQFAFRVAQVCFKRLGQRDKAVVLYRAAVGAGGETHR